MVYIPGGKWNPSTWVNGIGNLLGWSQGERNYRTAQIVSGIPVAGAIARAGDESKKMSDYLRNRGLSYDDIRYPYLTPENQSIGSASNQAMGFVSSNISRLYQGEGERWKNLNDRRKKYWDDHWDTLGLMYGLR